MQPKHYCFTTVLIWPNDLRNTLQSLKTNKTNQQTDKTSEKPVEKQNVLNQRVVILQFPQTGLRLRL